LSKSIATGLSLPAELYIRIEAERGDISRSRYLLRLLEKALNEETDTNKTEANKAAEGFVLNKEPQSQMQTAQTTNRHRQVLQKEFNAV
jgi:metal-responsive CopG/Arc/MetJ family transcriptional regulator